MGVKDGNEQKTDVGESRIGIPQRLRHGLESPRKVGGGVQLRLF